MREAKQLILRRLENDLERERQKYEAALRDREGALGGAAASLDFQLKQCEANIDRIETELNREQALMVDQANQLLIQLLEAYPKNWEQIQTAYQFTRLNWPKRDDLVATPAELVNILSKMLPAPELNYIARDEFVVQLLERTNLPGELIHQIQAWMTDLRPTSFWEEIRQRLQESAEYAAQQTRLSLVLVFEPAEEESIEQQEDCYRLSAWLAEHVQQPSSYHQLQVDVQEPAPVDELISSLHQLMEAFNLEQKKRCPSVIRKPEVHVFVPQGLLGMATNQWISRTGRRPRFFERQYQFYLHCLERYQDSYQDWRLWRSLWNHVERRLDEPAQASFCSGCDDELEVLDEVLQEALDGCDTSLEHDLVGFKLEQPPTVGTGDDDNVFQLLLDFGLPIILWGRKSLTDDSYGPQLDGVLNQGNLRELGEAVRRKRAEARARDCPPETHLGHHLALVWDDPEIQNPLTA